MYSLIFVLGLANPPSLNIPCVSMKLNMKIVILILSNVKLFIKNKWKMLILRNVINNVLRYHCVV